LIAAAAPPQKFVLVLVFVIAPEGKPQTSAPGSRPSSSALETNAKVLPPAQTGAHAQPLPRKPHFPDAAAENRNGYQSGINLCIKLPDVKKRGDEFLPIAHSEGTRIDSL